MATPTVPLTKAPALFWVVLILLSVFGLLSACTQPVPNEYAAYVGYWEGGNQTQDVKLLIKDNGYGIFELSPVSRRGDTGYNPVRHTGQVKFYGTQFVIGYTTQNAPTFVVARAPFADGQDTLVDIGDFRLKKMPMSAASQAFLEGEETHASDEFDGLYNGE